MRKATLEILQNLSEKHGESFYLLDSDVFEENFDELLNSFRKYYRKTNIAYSYKTNYVPKLTSIVKNKGGYAEVVSLMELDLARKIGMPVDMVVWNGPVKDEYEMENFLLQGGMINVDSFDEWQVIKRIAIKNTDKVINIGVRCNYEIGDGVISRFGFDATGDEFIRVIEEIVNCDNVHLKSIHSHFAKRNYKYWEKRTKGLIKIYQNLVDKYGLKPEILDLGGGMSGNMPDTLRLQMHLEKFSYDDYASNCAKIFYEYFGDDENSPWLFIEPGTAIAANCMRYVCRVKSIKSVSGKEIITTSGSQKNINMSGYNPPMDIIHTCDKSFYVKNADIAGYTCIESDYLFRSYDGEIGLGDFVVFGSCGSYSVVMKPPFIFPNCAVVDISGDKVEVINRGETFDDIFRTFIF